MKVTILQENLAYGLSIVSRAVAARSTLPVLNNILIATSEGGLQLSATDLEIGIPVGSALKSTQRALLPCRLAPSAIWWERYPKTRLRCRSPWTHKP